MKNAILTIVSLAVLGCQAQYKTMLHAKITPTNSVVVDIPDWAKSDTPPVSEDGILDYNVLTNKPSINGTIIEGALTTEDLGITAGASDYNDLTNKPSINGVELAGNKSASDLGLATPDEALLAIYYPEGNVTSIEQITTEGLEYSYDDATMTATLTRGWNATGDVVIPWKVVKDGVEYKVTAVGDNSFESNDAVTSLIAPTTVTSIGVSAFSACPRLTSVSLPSATSIGTYAFVGCFTLTNVSLPSATSIGSGAFSSCSRLTSVSLPSATSIGTYAFEICTALNSVNFGTTPRDSVPTLGHSAFIEVPTSCKFIIPLGMYDEWIAAPNWSDLYERGYKFDGYASVSQIVGVPNVSATGSVVQVGLDAYVGSTNSVAIGNDSGAQGNLNSMPKTFANDDGETTYATVPNSALGAVAEGFQSLARGAGAVAVGSQASGYGTLATSIGSKSYSHGNNAIAIGGNASVRGAGAIQIGAGRNEATNTVQIGEYRVLNADGTIPHERVTGLSNGNETRTADSLFRSMDNQNVIWTYVYGESVWIAVTNYMRSVGGVAPSFQLFEVRDGKTNLVYWSAEEIDTRVGDKIDIAMSNIVDNVVTAKADRAWSKYQSMTGADNPQPNDVTIVSTPSIMLSGGYEWQRFVDTGAEVWVLKCNDLITLGADTNAYFRITDLEGETQFAIEKTASKLVDAVPTATGFTADGNNYFKVTFSGNIQPTIYVSLDLVNSPFIECSATENDYGLTCSWEHDSAANTYTATIAYNAGDGRPTKMFVYGKVLQEGSTVVKHTAPSSFDGGIIINDVQYSVGTATIDGNTVMTLNPVTRAVSE